MNNFNTIINRAHTNSVKYDLRKTYFKNDEVLPMWVADMDFETPDFIRKLGFSRWMKASLSHLFLFLSQKDGLRRA